ncbi:MAG: hypothetical protein H7235_03860 [Bdellovibrionaceae bacterium]|nr:hypothetical protein [Pseudobdellovibrionaceae bacterium]
MKMTISLIFLFFASCAQPKYVNENNNNQDNNSADQTGADCSTRFAQSQVCVSWYWEKKPTSSDIGSLIFKTFRLNTFDHTAIELNTVSVPQVQLWMPGMGHGSTPTHVTQLDVGTYRAENVFFIMPGEWDMRFQIKDGDTVSDEALMHITF